MSTARTPETLKIDSIVSKLGFHCLGATASLVSVSAAASSDPHATGISLAALGITGLGWLGSYWTNLAASRRHDYDSRKIPPAEALLHNHDLTWAVGLAVQKTLEAAQQVPDLLKHVQAKEILSLLRDHAVEAYTRLVTSVESAAELVRPETLIATLESTQSILSGDEWRALLENLFADTVPDWDKEYDRLRPQFEKLLDPVARYMGEAFPHTIRELMKHKSANPDLARAHAAIEMHVWAQMLCFVRESPDRDAGLEEQIVARIESGLRNMGDAAIERHSELLNMTELECKLVIF